MSEVGLMGWLTAKNFYTVMSLACLITAFRLYLEGADIGHMGVFCALSVAFGAHMKIAGMQQRVGQQSDIDGKSDREFLKATLNDARRPLDGRGE